MSKLIAEIGLNHLEMINLKNVQKTHFKGNIWNNSANS